MKLKFIVNNLIAAAMVCGVSCSVTSCKDTDSDLYSQLKEDNANLQKQIDEINGRLATCKEECKAEILAQVQLMLQNYQLKGDYVTNAELEARVADFITGAELTDRLSNYLTEAEVRALIAELRPGLTAEEVTNIVNTLLSNYYTKDAVDALIDAKIAELAPTTPALTEEQIKALIDYAISNFEFPETLSKEEIQALIDYAISKLPTSNVTIEDVKNAIAAVLQVYDQKMQDIINQITAISNTLVELLNKDYVTQNTLTEILENYVKKGDLTTILENYLQAADLDGYLKTAELAAEINKLIQGNSTEFSTIKEVLDAIVKANGLEARVSDIEAFIAGLNDSVLEQKFQAIKDQLTNLREDVNNLNNRIDALTGRLNNFITGIIAQSIFNPVFGTLNLPIDVKSNILLCYYGHGDNKVDFPTYSTLNAFNGSDGYVLTSEDLELLKNNGLLTDADIFKVAAKEEYADGKLGNVYLTINPVNRDFTGVTLTLENSRGEKSPVVLTGCQKSDDLLSFGYSRADNGFYKVNASIDPSQISKIKINIEDGLGKAIEEAFTNRKANDVAYMGKLLYNQFQDIFPALAVRADWQDGDNMNSVLSEYAIAATSYRPLSFSFLAERDLNKYTLPNIPDWNNIEFTVDVPTLKYTCEPMNVEGIAVPVEYGTIAYSITPEETIKITIGTWQTFSASGTLKTTEKDFVFYAPDVDHLVQAFSYQINATMPTLPEAAKANLVAAVNNMIDKEMAQLEIDINENIADIVADLEQQVKDRVAEYCNEHLRKFTSRIQTAINRINGLLDHPNYYMQPCLFYGVDGTFYSRLSTSKAFPTQFKINGTKKGINIYPSTFNAEVLTPAFKKFVAVTNVWTATASAADNDAACLNVLKQVNSKGYLCKPVNGNRLTMGLELIKVGNETTTYEIVYQALDYHGKISTIKCYATIK